MYLRKEDRWKLLVFLLPAVVLFIAYFLYPLIYVIVMSFYKWDAFHPPEYRGFANYAALFKDLTFRRALGNNLTWAGVDMVVKVPLAMMMALILSKKIRGWKFFRTVYFLPQVISGIAMAAMWSAVYNLDYGLLNGVVKLFGGEPVNWLGNVKVAFICVIAYGLLYIGYFMVIMMAEITGIDTTYYEAAAIDGATNLQTDIHITIPMIRSSLAKEKRQPLYGFPAFCLCPKPSDENGFSHVRVYYKYSFSRLIQRPCDINHHRALALVGKGAGKKDSPYIIAAEADICTKLS